MAATDTPRFGFRLVSLDGDAFGTVESAERHWRAGDIVTADGVGYRVLSVTSIELIGEFVDRPLHGLLWVEPI